MGIHVTAAMEDIVTYVKMAYGEFSDEARAEVKAKDEAAAADPQGSATKLQAAYEECAADAGKGLTLAEFGTFCEKTKRHPEWEVPTEDQLKVMFAFIDKDGDGHLCLEEVMAFLMALEEALKAKQ